MFSFFPLLRSLNLTDCFICTIVSHVQSCLDDDDISCFKLSLYSPFFWSIHFRIGGLYVPISISQIQLGSDWSLTIFCMFKIVAKLFLSYRSYLLRHRQKIFTGPNFTLKFARAVLGRWEEATWSGPFPFLQKQWMKQKWLNWIIIES